MPIKVPDHLPAKQILQKENIFAMGYSRAFHQDIRPLKIAILNLMPDKQSTEVQLLRLIANTPLQSEITLLHMQSHTSKNTSSEYLNEFYDVFDEVQHKKFDGMIITGAPIEHLEFEEVSYWEELIQILEWTKSNVTNTLHICWAAQAALYYHYGVPKYPLDKKMFGVFQHSRTNPKSNLMRGFDDFFSVPHSRHTGIKKEEILNVKELEILSESEEAGIYMVASKDERQIFVTGHSEYDPDTLKNEYERDLAKGESLDIPKHYFLDDNPTKPPCVTWRGHSNLLFNNWLNYYVYQETPYELN